MSEADTTIVVQSLSCAGLFATPWTVAHQASLSFTVSRSLLLLFPSYRWENWGWKFGCGLAASVLPRTLYAGGREDASSCAVSQSLLRIPVQHHFSCLCLSGLACTQQSEWWIVLEGRPDHRMLVPQSLCPLLIPTLHTWNEHKLSLLHENCEDVLTQVCVPNAERPNKQKCWDFEAEKGLLQGHARRWVPHAL